MIQRRKTKTGVRYDVRLYRANGTQYSKTFRTKKDAERYEATQHADKSRGTWIDPTAGNMLFADWSAEWFETNKRQWRQRTIDKHEMALRVHWVPALGGAPLNSITPRIVQRIINHMADVYSPSSIQTYFGTLSGCMTSAIEFELLTRSPCKGIKLPTPQDKEKKVITPQELQLLSRHVPEQWRCFILIGGIMGLRFGEIAALKRQDIDFENRTIAIRRTLVESNGTLEFGPVKTRAGQRTLAMPTTLTTELENHIEAMSILQDQDLVFPDCQGGPIRRSNFNRRTFKPAVNSCGLRGLTFHGLRHSAATQWIKNGIDLRTVQTRLGHAKPKLVLDLYAHATTDGDRAAADKLEDIYWTSKEEEER